MNFFITIFFSLATFLCANPIYHSFDDGDKAPLLQDNIMSASVTNTLNEKSKAFDSCGIGCASDTIRSPQKRNACPARSTKEPRPQNSVEGNREILPQDLQNPATNTPTRPFAEDGACDDHFPHVKHLYCGGPIIRRFPFDSVLNCVPCESASWAPFIIKVGILIGHRPCETYTTAPPISGCQ